MKQKQNTIITLSVMYLVLLFLVFHLGYFIDSISNFKIVDLSNFSSYLTTELIKTPFNFFKNIVTKKMTLYLPFVFTIVFFLYLLSISSNLKKYNRKGVEHGSASWGILIDFKNLKDKKKENNIILSKNLLLSLNGRKTNMNNNIVVYGSSGTGKSRNFVIPNILQGSTSYVITDPKGSILNNTSNALKEMGYKIKILNLIDMTKSNKYNPFEYLESEEDVFILIDNLIENTNGESKKSTDPFWVQSEKSLLSAIILFLWRYVKTDKQNFLEVLNCVHNFGKQNFYLTIGMEKLEERARMTGEVDTSLVSYRTVMMIFGNEKTFSSILISSASRLNLFNISSVRSLMSKDTLDLNEVGREKTALFIIIPDTNKTFNFIVSMLYTQLFQLLITQADTNFEEALEQPVQFLLDEFANIGKIPNFEILLATIRSRGISTSIIVQNLAQIKAMYKDTWEVILGNCDTNIFLGSTEIGLLEYLVKIFGKETTSIKNKGSSRTPSKSSSYSQNENVIGRELITIDELRLLENNECIVSMRRKRPFKDKKFNLKKHYNYKKTGEVTNIGFNFDILKEDIPNKKIFSSLLENIRVEKFSSEDENFEIEEVNIPSNIKKMAFSNINE